MTSQPRFRFRTFCFLFMAVSCAICIRSYIDFAEKTIVYSNHLHASKSNSSGYDEFLEELGLITETQEPDRNQKPQFPHFELYFFLFSLVVVFASLIFTALNWKKKFPFEQSAMKSEDNTPVNQETTKDPWQDEFIERNQ